MYNIPDLENSRFTLYLYNSFPLTKKGHVLRTQPPFRQIIKYFLQLNSYLIMKKTILFFCLYARYFRFCSNKIGKNLKFRFCCVLIYHEHIKSILCYHIHNHHKSIEYTIENYELLECIFHHILDWCTSC